MLDAPDLQESRDLLLVPSNCGDGVPSGIRPVSIGRACDSQPRVRSGCSVGEASLKQANILGSTDSRHTVFPDRMKPQRARSMRFLAPGARPSCLIALLYQPFLSLVNTATRKSDCVVMFIYEFDIKSVNTNQSRRPPRLRAHGRVRFRNS